VKAILNGNATPDQKQKDRNVYSGKNIENKK
jgi:hypothetical protein